MTGYTPEPPDSFDALPPANGWVDSVTEQAGGVADLRRGRRTATAEIKLTERVDRLPPHSNEAEQGVLGCCLLTPRECVPLVVSKFRGNVEVLYDVQHQTILTVLFRMFEMNYEIDTITVQQRLSDFDQLESCGGIPYLNALQDGVPSAANLSYYCDIVLDKFLLREAVRVGTEVVGSAFECNGDARGMLDKAEAAILGIRRGLETSESSGMKELVPAAIASLQSMADRKGSLTGIASGFSDFDRMTTGLQNGEMIVIAGRPSLGKSSLAMNIADHVAVNLGLPVGVFSLEMTKEALTARLISSRARVNLRNVTEGFLSVNDLPKLDRAAAAIEACPLRIDDTPGLSIMELRARARSMWQQYGIKLFVVDYLQLLHSATKRGKENRQLEVTEISGGIKALAKELNVPVLVLSQLNREIERGKRKPNLSDLRESGSIEQDSDLVAFLYKPDYDAEEAAEEAEGLPVNLLIAKQRNGPTGTVNLTFLKTYTRFESAAKVGDDDVPADYNQRVFNPEPATTKPTASP